MSERGVRSFGIPRLAWKGMAAAAVLLASGTAWGQSQSANPYYQNGLEAYAFPSVPNNLALPNQARMSATPGAGRTRYNRFDQFREELNSLESNLDTSSSGAETQRRASRVGVPYYESYRQYDRTLGRTFVPGAKADTEFFEKQQDRNARYFDAMKERDPAKRAQMLREIQKESQLAARSQGVSPRRPAAPEIATTPRRDAAAPSATTTPANPNSTATKPSAVNTLPVRPGVGASRNNARTSGRSNALSPSPLRSNNRTSTDSNTGNTDQEKSRVRTITPLRSTDAAAPTVPGTTGRPRAGAGGSSGTRPLTVEEIMESRRAGRAATTTPPVSPAPPPR